MFFEVAAFRETNPIVLAVVFEAVFFERDRGTWVIVTVLAILRWVCAVVLVSAFGIPTVERFSEFFNDSLCSKIVDFWHHENQRFSNELD